MTEKETEQQIKNRILILCVDRDGDLEVKAGIKTPLQGRTANLDAAVSLALRDPEEPDANAMFEAVRLYDRLESEKQPEENFEVATISGSELGGVGADRKLVAELGKLLGSFSANEVILVSDGYSDEAILPLVESRVPVSSVRRIVVKHSESIEETAALFSRYMRLIWENPRYARIALGIPGLLFFLYGIFYIIPGAVNYYLISILLILGGVLLFKGFGVDRGARNLYKWAREYSPPPLPVQISNYSIIAGILCIAVSVYLGAASANANVVIEPPDISGWINALPKLSAFFIKGLMDLMVVGIGIILFGRSIRLYFERDPRLLRNVALVVSIAWFRWILDATADILIAPGVGFDNEVFSALVFTIVVGILIGIASVLLVIIIHRSTKGFFRESEDDADNFGGPAPTPSETQQQPPSFPPEV
jgi:putative membrane protein